MSLTTDPSRGSTDQQHAAITTLDRNVVVVAGAGTGKTFVLVHRFVELLAQDPAWPISAIVAITFTNRAADEMRGRVRTELENRRRAARTPVDIRRWTDLLAQIETARITTIHGLCSEIVRANAANAEVDPGFEVLDETQAAILREDAVTQALAEAAGTGALTDEERALAGSVIARYGESDIREALVSAALLNAELGAVKTHELLYAEWETLASRLLNPHLLSSLSYSPPDGDDLLAAQARLARIHLSCVNDTALTLDTRLEAVRALTGISLSGGSAKKWPDVKQAKTELRLLKAAAESLLEHIGVPPGDQDADAAGLLEGWHLLIERTRYAYFMLKQVRATLDYDDLETQAMRVLSERSVRARYIDAEFKHVMVDEFQDTNRRQWAIVKAVAPPDRPGALFLVGDPKQSIYSFRGADVTVFAQARTEITAHGGIVLYLTESFRSHKPLVESLNGLFDAVLRRPENALDGSVFVTFDSSQRLESRREAAPDAPFIAAYGVPKDTNGDRGIVREARAAAQAIRKLVKAGTEMVWRGGSFEKVRYGDIALLLRSFRNRVEVFERALTDEGIPYITHGGQGFFGRREVRDLLSALKALHNPADELSLAAALHGPLFAVSDVDLLRLREPRYLAGENEPRVLPMFAALLAEAEDRRSRSLDYDPLVFSVDVLERLMPLVGRAPVETLIQMLIHETGYMATLAGLPNGLQMRANVEKLIDRARDSGLTALNVFVRYLRDMTESEAKEGGVPLEADDAVRVTTIHSSKGLEYPVVWIADAGSEGGRGGGDSLLNWNSELGCKLPRPDQLPLNPLKPDDDDKLHPYVYRRNRMLRGERDRAESLRLLYVAATRAKDALFISGQVNKDGTTKGWLEAIRGQIEPIELTPALTAPRESPVPLPVEDFDTPLNFPLAQTLPASPPPTRLQLSASDITALGGWHSAPDVQQRNRHLRSLRRRVLDEQRDPIPLLTYDADDGQLAVRRTGSLIHDALRYGYDTLIDTDREQATALIRAMAWENGITQTGALEKSVDMVIGALVLYRRSYLCRELERAVAVYRELPFVFQRDGHVVHGVIDLIYRAPDGTWTLVDYKTDKVDPDEAAMRAQARMYHLQMAVYAEAVAAQVGQVPRVMLLFLRWPSKPVTLDPAELRAELDAVPLDTLIEMLREDAT